MPALGARGPISLAPPVARSPIPKAPAKAAPVVAPNPQTLATLPRARVNYGRTVAAAGTPRGTGVGSPAGYRRQTAQVNKASANQHSDAYKRAVIETFLHQPAAQKAVIVRNALKTPSFEGDLILGKGMTPPDKQKMGDLIPALAKIFSPSSVYGAHGAGAVASQSQGGNLAAVVPFGGAKGATQILGNTAKDAINLPAQTFSTLGTLGGDVASGNVGKAVSDVVSPYKQLLSNPAAAAYQHPLDTYLMAAGPVHGATRAAAGAVRAAAPDSALGKIVSTNREGVQLGGKLTHERPRYSPAPLIKAGQVATEKAKFTRAPTGELVPRSPSLRARLTALETSRLVGVNERIRTANRDAAIGQRVRAVAPSLAAKAGHGAKTALRYNPQAAAIPGADVLARIADGTIRRPDTFTQDLQKHLQQVSANRPNLADNPKLLAEHDAYVKKLTAVSKQKLSPKNLDKLFAAAAAYAKDYKPVETEAKGFGHFGQRSDEALLKRTLSHYAVTHMGAYFDHTHKGLDPSAPVRGLVRDLVHEGGRVTHGVPLKVAEIQAHMKGSEGVGGRELAFTSDKPKAGSAFYLSSERRPLPETATNTLFGYTHGLTDPTHQALLEQHVRMQGTVDAHKAMNRTADAISVMRKDGTAWPSYTAAKQDAPPGYRPIALAEPFHPQKSLDEALHGVDPAKIDEEAATHGLDLSSRLSDSGQGRWALADENALKRIEQHKAQITSNPAMRAFKMTNNQFRQVALGTSAKHIPGVISEGIIRDVANGVGVSSWITGRRLLNRTEQLEPDLGKQARIQLTGGTVAGATKAMMTRQVSDHFLGTNLHTPLKAFETFMRAPGPRQARNAWHAWTRLAINGTKHYIEEQNQTAGVGKAALKAFGAEHGPFAKALRIQGSMLDDAAKGLVDPAKLRQFRAEVENIYGRWTDLTPTGQTGMMLSPFGLWWTNSVKWLARNPVDRPVQSGALASATVGTQQERNAKGLDLFAPNAVPGYMQGGIPLSGGRILAQNYYSPYGVANEPLQSAASLVEPWLQSPLLGSLGDNYLGKTLNSPGNSRGYKKSNTGQKAQYVINSLLASFLPLYSKAETIAQGGASAYDNSSLLFGIHTKTPGQGFGAGLGKALTPYRMYHSSGGTSKTSGPFGKAPSTSGYDPFHSSASANPF